MVQYKSEALNAVLDVGNADQVSDRYVNKKVLVPGGLGFIGSCLVRRLVHYGAAVTLVDAMMPDSGANLFNIASIRDHVDLVIGDLCDPNLITKVIPGQDFIFNMAGQVGHLASMRDPLKDHRNNSLSSLMLLEGCKQFNPGVKILYAGTRQIYGRPNYLPVDEIHPIVPLDFNGVSKYSGELYHMVAHRIHGLRTTILRLSNVYGPGMRIKDDRQTFIGSWFRSLIDGNALRVFGSGDQIRDLIFVEDVVDAMLTIAVNAQSDGEIYNLGSGKPIRLLNLAETMVRINQQGSFQLEPFPEDRKRIDIGNYYTDTRKIFAATGWQAKTPLEEGIAITLRYYRENKPHYT